MQKRQRFVADQRYDLSNLDAQMQYVADEFYKYNQQFICASNRIIKGWAVIAGAGLQAKVVNTAGSLLIARFTRLHTAGGKSARKRCSGSGVSCTTL